LWRKATEDIVEEAVPWIFGLVLGAAISRPFRSTPRAVCFLMLMAALGISVTVFTGEWAQNPGFALVDIGQVGLAAALAAFGRPYVIGAILRRSLRTG